MSKLIKWYRQHQAEARAYNDLLAEVHGTSRLDKLDWRRK